MKQVCAAAVLRCSAVMQLEDEKLLQLEDENHVYEWSLVYRVSPESF